MKSIVCKMMVNVHVWDVHYTVYGDMKINKQIVDYGTKLQIHMYTYLVP